MCIHVITVTSDGRLTHHQVLHGNIPCIFVRRTRAFQECGQILEKPRYAVGL